MLTPCKVSKEPISTMHWAVLVVLETKHNILWLVLVQLLYLQQL